MDKWTSDGSSEGQKSLLKTYLSLHFEHGTYGINKTQILTHLLHREETTKLKRLKERTIVHQESLQTSTKIPINLQKQWI